MVAFEIANYQEARKIHNHWNMVHSFDTHNTVADLFSLGTNLSRESGNRSVHRDMAKRSARNVVFSVCKSTCVLCYTDDSHINMLHPYMV